MRLLLSVPALIAVGVFVTFAQLPSSSPAPNQETQGRQCAENPEVVGECFEVRGRLRFYNGNPSFRLWPVASKRLLGLLPDEEPIVPSDVAPYLHRLVEEPGLDVFGNFKVCPYTPERRGEMRYVCVESAKNLVEYRR